ncbi:hypothetical protein MKEN_00555900 [Mycena kentingensis (nom. inval.)]|nr:hypothetical protein MKEN_00555900 [Mycena kentingensis (nom. inval.)]
MPSTDAPANPQPPKPGMPPSADGQTTPFLEFMAGIDPAEDRYQCDVRNSNAYHEFRQNNPDAIPPARLGIPLRHLHPHDWNFYFEHEYKDKYRPGGNPYRYWLETHDFFVEGFRGNAPLAQKEHVKIMVTLSIFHFTFTPYVVEVMERGDFERAWVAMGKAEREELALKALIRGADVAHERGRMDCPEMSMENMVGDGEFSVLSLLKAVAAYRGEEGPLYVYTHPAFEAEISPLLAYGKGHWRFTYAHIRVAYRLYFISATLSAILDIHAGIPPSAGDTQDIDRTFYDVPACFQCGAEAPSPASESESASASPSGTAATSPATLSRCSACAFATYCSAACQKRNWREHKEQCASIKAIRPLDPELKFSPIECRAVFAGGLKRARCALKWR